MALFDFPSFSMLLKGVQRIRWRYARTKVAVKHTENPDRSSQADMPGIRGFRYSLLPKFEKGLAARQVVLASVYSFAQSDGFRWSAVGNDSVWVDKVQRRLSSSSFSLE